MWRLKVPRGAGHRCCTGEVRVIEEETGGSLVLGLSVW